MSEDDAPDLQPGRSRFFITRGMRLALQRFSLSINDDGSVSSTGAFEVALDLCPYWLEIAVEHAIEADERHRETLAALGSPDDQRLSVALEREFSEGVQGVVAAAIALDAFYEALREHVPLPEETVDAWNRTKAKRYKRIAEVMRVAFRIRPRPAARLRAAIRELFSFRDRAVHPSAQLAAPVRHPDLPSLGVEWRFVAFRSDNAKAAAGTALQLIVQLTNMPSQITEVSGYCEGARARLMPIRERWEQRFGPLIAPDSNTRSADGRGDPAV